MDTQKFSELVVAQVCTGVHAVSVEFDSRGEDADEDAYLMVKYADRFYSILMQKYDEVYKIADCADTDDYVSLLNAVLIDVSNADEDDVSLALQKRLETELFKIRAVEGYVGGVIYN